jgi:hypothetical protein
VLNLCNITNTNTFASAVKQTLEQCDIVLLIVLNHTNGFKHLQIYKSLVDAKIVWDTKNSSDHERDLALLVNAEISRILDEKPSLKEIDRPLNIGLFGPTDEELSNANIIIDSTTLFADQLIQLLNNNDFTSRSRCSVGTEPTISEVPFSGPQQCSIGWPLSSSTPDHYDGVGCASVDESSCQVGEVNHWCTGSDVSGNSSWS